MKKLLKNLSLFCLGLCILLGVSSHVQAAKLVTPDRAVRSGSNVYWAIGCEWGNLMKTNVKTGTSTTLLKKPCNHISVSKNMLYFTVNEYGGTDFTNYYICRVGTNGKNYKQLAKGRCPVVIGNYIYYIQLNKKKQWGNTVDDTSAGIYRMKLNGSGKKCLYRDTTLGDALLSKVSSKLLAVGKASWRIGSEEFYTISTSGKNKTTASFGTDTLRNTSPRWPLYSVEKLGRFAVCNNSKGEKFTSSGSDLYRTGKSKRIAHFNGMKIHKIIDMNGYVAVVLQPVNSTGGVSNGKLVLMDRNGKNKKTLRSFPLVGGSW